MAIDNKYEEIELITLPEEPKETQIKVKFYRLFYKTFYFLLVNIVINSINIKDSKDDGVNIYSIFNDELEKFKKVKILMKFNEKGSSKEKAIQYISNAGYIKNAKYDNKIKKFR